MKNQRKLRNYLIHPRFQIKYLSWMSTVAILLAATVFGLLYRFVRDLMEMIHHLIPLSETARTQIDLQLQQTLLKTGGVALIFIVLICLFGLVMSHKAAGPLHQLRLVCLKVASGDWTARVRFRPEDDFHEVGEAFNLMLTTVESRLSSGQKGPKENS
jgi:nitrogen fixation/metabolism regulation signal transduction histidine kinase